MDYYDYFMTKHNILHFSGFKRWESSRGDNSLKRYQTLQLFDLFPSHVFNDTCPYQSKSMGLIWQIMDY